MPERPTPTRPERWSVMQTAGLQAFPPLIRSMVPMSWRGMTMLGIPRNQQHNCIGCGETTRGSNGPHNFILRCRGITLFFVRFLASITATATARCPHARIHPSPRVMAAWQIYQEEQLCILIKCKILLPLYSSKRQLNLAVFLI